MVPGAGIELIGELGHIRDLCGILLAFYADTPSLRSLTIVDFVESNRVQYPGIHPVSRSHLVRAALNSGITQPVQTRLKGLHTFKLLNFFARLLSLACSTLCNNHHLRVGKMACTPAAPEQCVACQPLRGRSTGCSPSCIGLRTWLRRT